MKEMMTTCEVADSVKAWKCQTEEQCDDCFMVDHLKECSGCEHYEHPVKTVEELRTENEKMFTQILADLKEINEMTEKTAAILKDVTNNMTSRL